jgi:hypothetical protein
MTPKTICIFLILLAGLLACAGCTATTGPTPAATVLTPEPITPVKATTPITPLPENEIARIKVDHFGLDPDTGTIYEFMGKVQTREGPYRSVQVLLHYPDNQEYSYDVGGMGGANATIKEFSLFPADRYKGTNPEKIVVLDGTRYGTVYKYEDGLIAWIATPGSVVTP